MADIIILNGTSSSGKSALAKALQQCLDTPYLHAGIDHYIFALPKQYLYPPLWSQVFEYEYADGTITAIKPGALGQQLVSAMHQATATLAAAGFNVVVDHVLFDLTWLDEMAVLFYNYRVWFIGVRCPLAVAEARERGRENRTLGQARAQFPVVHAGKAYDFEVDTSLGTPETCAQWVKAHLATNPAPRTLRQRAQTLLPKTDTRPGQ